jgi:signal peptidase I
VSDAATDHARLRRAGAVLGLGLHLVLALVLLSSPLLFRAFMFQPYTIPSASMEPTLRKGDYVIVSKEAYGYSHHSIIFSPPVFRGRLFFKQPQRGDLVVFKLPRDGRTDYIKRLIGLPGDKVQIRAGRLYLNGVQLPESRLEVIPVADRGSAEQATVFAETIGAGRRYMIEHHAGEAMGDNTGPYVVPPHCYFMLGDNRDNAADSRFDPGLVSGDPKLGGCGWDSRLDAAVDFATGVGFVPEENLLGRVQFVVRKGAGGNLTVTAPK